MQAVFKVTRTLGPLGIALLLTACGGGAAPASSAPAASSPAAASLAASKPAASTAASAKPAASASAKPAASGAASAKPAASGAASAKPAASGAASKPAASGAAATLPPIPATVPVTVDPKTTVFTILDINQAVCASTPACTATVPAISGFLKKARAAKMPVVYSTTGLPPASPSPIIADIAPQQGDPIVPAKADKFINTDLDATLKKLGAKTLIVVGGASNGAVLYSSFHANALGYTVAVAVDAISARNPIDTTVAEYQLLNQPGASNADNKPLAPNVVTLTRTNQITIS
jgi:nicotinamidase-related amidase